MEEKCLDCGQIVRMILKPYGGHVEKTCPNCGESTYDSSKNYKVAHIKQIFVILLATLAH